MRSLKPALAIATFAATLAACTTTDNAYYQPSYGYSQQCGGRSAIRVESRGADMSTNSQTSAWLGPSARTRGGGPTAI